MYNNDDTNSVTCEVYISRNVWSRKMQIIVNNREYNIIIIIILFHALVAHFLFPYSAD